MKLLVSFILSLSFAIQADSDLLLGQEGSDIDLSATFVKQKQYQLDDPFLIQLYSAWKTLGQAGKSTDAWVNLILDKEFELGLKYLGQVKSVKDITLIKNASELYLLYRLGFHQTFFSRWIDISSQTNYLSSQMAVALDQMLAKSSSNLLLNYGFTFDENQLKALEKIEERKSFVNYSIQALKALRAGKGALPWISKVRKDDPLKMMLAQSALLEFARLGQLGASAKLIKKVIEPAIEESQDREEIALYYLTLARLLYQAKAYPAAQEYFYRVPDSSKYYLSARTENLWALLKTKQFGRAKGELESLKMELFSDRFNPEIYLVNAIANVLMCQFSDAKTSFDQFISNNKKWVSHIDQQLVKLSKGQDVSPVWVDRSISNLDYQLISLEEEKRLMEQSVSLSNGLSIYRKNLTKMKNLALEKRRQEIHRQWLDRKIVLTDAIYKMKFVKVEFISRMREVDLKRKDHFSDEVSTYHAAPVKDNHLSFPSDQMAWGDEVFKMDADVLNQCMKQLQGN